MSPPPPPDLAVVAAAADRALDRVANLVRGISDLGATAVGSWTMQETAAHLLGVVGAYAAVARGEGSPFGDLSRVAEVNEAALAAVSERRPRELGEQLQNLRPEVRAALAGPDVEIAGHGAEPLRTSVAAGRILGEAVVHGWDIAKAAGRLWVIDPADAALVFRCLLPCAPRFVDPVRAHAVTARFDVRVRKFPEARAVFAFADGVLTVEESPQGRVDCVLSAAPGPLILVMHRRIGLRRPILTGDLAAWGRRPWLGTRLVDLFDPP